ncbi:acyltransferase [Dyadobacter sp. CY356]|uniref:acyltransferase family protein n=1 Tax=Dyadobacter sp. CY356 TaxID=2906442 RepID=UPI001F44D3AD|nr:acyltransferase family protein [Dyadobacter sp. CY356]MCF0058320.1 acyltransferase family protein [Dyadobacter sp. CY356]
MKIGKLESIRGFVALYVMLTHFIQFYKTDKTPKILISFFYHAQEAVLVFFLLSGFVIYLSFYNNGNITFYDYAKKRWLRIFPITIASFILSIAVLLCNKDIFHTSDVIDFFGNLLMLQDLGSNPGIIVLTFLKNYPLWSLSYEWWFYLMFYPLIQFFDKQEIKNSIYYILIFSIIGWLLYLVYPNHLLLIAAYFLLWWCGVEAARIYTTKNTFGLTGLFPILVSLLIMSCILAVPVIKGIMFEHKSLSEINSIIPYSTHLHFYGSAFVIIITGLIWWNFKLRYFDMIFGYFKIFAPVSFAMYIIHYPILWLNILILDNVYFTIIFKIVLILFLSYLLEQKFQPVVFSFSKRKSLSKQKVSTKVDQVHGKEKVG